MVIPLDLEFGNIFLAFHFLWIWWKVNLAFDSTEQATNSYDAFAPENVSKCLWSFVSEAIRFLTVDIVLRIRFHDWSYLNMFRRSKKKSQQMVHALPCLLLI